MSTAGGAALGRGRAQVFLRCPRFLEDDLNQEVEEIIGKSGKTRAGGVQVSCTVREAIALCLASRLASRVLWPLAAFDAADADGLYAGVAALDWDALLGPVARLAVGFDGTSPALRHTRFSVQRVKDAVVDSLRAARGERPDVDPKDPELWLQGVLHRGRVTLHLDLAGTALHRRGWRRDGGAAPLKENLAAALLRRAGWGPGRTDRLVDPLCGSGTLLVEGALMAAGIAPGVLRERFGFECWRGAPDDIRAELEAAMPMPAGPVRLAGRDVDPAQIERTREHLEAAGAGTRFEADVDLAVADIADMADLASGAGEDERAWPEDVGLVVTNPPYGVRLEDGDALPALGRALRRHAPDRAVGVLVASGRDTPARPEDLVARLDLPRLDRHACRNGPLDAWMLTGTVEAGTEGAVDAAALEHAAMFANRVRKNAAHLGRIARRLGTDAFRLYDRDLPEYGLVVDRYGDALCVQEFRPPATVDPVLAARRRAAALAVLPEAAGVEAAAVFFRERRRQTPEDQYAVLDRRAERRAVTEDDARFEVNLSDYLDTGLYLDSRGVRRVVRETFSRRGAGEGAGEGAEEGAGTAGGRFLNLYAYTCTATVQAALGGAAETLSVDRSRTYLDWGERHFALNGLTNAAHRRVRADVLPWLEAGAGDAGPFDVILLDPPTFSNATGAEEDLDLQRDQGRLLDACVAQLAPGGRLFLVVHARRFRLQWTPPEGCTVAEITRSTLDPDCARGHPAHRCWRIDRADAIDEASPASVWGRKV